jgi:hypothetical protein
MLEKKKEKRKISVNVHAYIITNKDKVSMFFSLQSISFSSNIL